MNKDNYEFLINLLNEELRRLYSSYNRINANINNCKKNEEIYTKLIEKLKNREILIDDEIEFLKNDNSISKICDMNLVNKNILFIKQMEEFLSINSNLDKTFMEQYESIKEILENIIKILNNKNENHKISLHRNLNKYVEELKIVQDSIQNVKNILNYLLGNITILKDVDYKYLIELLKLNKDLSENDKKEIFLDCATYVYKQVEHKKDSLKKLNDDIVVYDVDEKTKMLFSDIVREDISKNDSIVVSKDDNEDNIVQVIDEKEVSEEELNEKRKKLHSLIKAIFDYLDNVYVIANDCNIDLNLNYSKEIENTFKTAYSLISENSVVSYSPKEKVGYIKYMLGDNFNLFKNYLFNESFLLYSFLKNDYSYLFDLYIRIDNDLDGFIKSLVDIKEIEKYINLFDEPMFLLKDANIPKEQEKFSNLRFYIEEEKLEHNLSNIGENVILFVEETVNDSINRNISHGSAVALSTHLKTGLRVMKEKGYGVLGQGNNARDQRMANIKDSRKCGITSALVKEGIDAKRFRQGNARIAFIPLNISSAVKDFIMKYFNCNLNNNNRVLLIFGFDYKCSSDEETYAIFNNYLGKKDKSSRSYQINKNRDVFDIFELFAKKELTEVDTEKIIKIIQSSSKMFSNILEDDLNLGLA